MYGAENCGHCGDLFAVEVFVGVERVIRDRLTAVMATSELGMPIRIDFESNRISYQAAQKYLLIY